MRRRSVLIGLTLLTVVACADVPDTTSPAVVWEGIEVGTSGPVGCTPWGDELRDGESSSRERQSAGANARTSTTNCTGTVELVCSDGTLQWGQWITCQLIIEPYDVQMMASVRRWSFDGANGSYTPAYSNFFTWEGPMIESGLISADVDVDGGVTPVSTYVMVSARPSATWGSNITTGPAVGTQIDHCVAADEIGLTANTSCTLATANRLFSPAYANATFHDPQPVTYGPNTGLWYVGNPVASMHLRKVLRRDLRADAIPMPVWTNSHPAVVSGCGTTGQRTINYVNTVCAPNAHSGGYFPGFRDLVLDNDAHEQNHLSLAFTAAQQTSGNLRQRLAPLVRRGQAALEEAAEIQHTNAHGYVSQQAMFHSGMSTLYDIFAPSLGTYTWTVISVPLAQ